MGMVALPLLDIDIEDLESDMKAGSTAAFGFHDYSEMHALDHQPGEPLDPILVLKARMGEMEFVKSMQLYEKVHVSEAVEATGQKLIAVRRVDLHTGDNTNPNYRSR